MKLNNLASCALVGLVSLSGLSQSAQAQAIFFSAPTTDFTNNAWSLGFEFTTNSAFDVNSLGFYDDAKNGLSQSHAVGIYNTSGTLLASTTVLPSDALNGYFRYHDISTLHLNAGQNYIISAETGSENYTYDPTGFGTDSRINFVASRYTVSSNLVFPTSSDGTKGYFGPNFTIGASAVPEPGAVALVMGTVGSAFFVRRRSVKR